MDCSHIYHKCIKQRRQSGRQEELGKPSPRTHERSFQMLLTRAHQLSMVQVLADWPVCCYHKALCAFRMETNTTFHT